MKENKLKVYSIYTNSHEALFREFFLPSLTNTDLELHATKVKQVGSGDCDTNDYFNGTLLKVRLIISAIKENFGGVFVFSDVDIVFFKKVSNDLLSRLKDNDILFQFQPNILHNTEINTGFFVCRANNKTLNLWQECEERLSISISLNIKMHDQDFINQIIKENPRIIKFKLLPIDRYSFCPDIFNFDKDKKDIILLSKSVCTYHAINTTIPSIENKEFLLSKVKEIYLNKQSLPVLKYYFFVYIKNYISPIFKKFYVATIGIIGIFLKKYCPFIYKLLKPYFPNKK